MHQPVVLEGEDAVEALLHRMAFVKAHYNRKPNETNLARRIEVADLIYDIAGLEVLRLAESDMCSIEVIDCQSDTSQNI